MALARRLRYYRRVFSAYSRKSRSQLSFWHEKPEVNERFEPAKLGAYHMTFEQKADYAGPFDREGIPLLDYRGELGVQYNPIAVAQYGLANYNIYLETRAPERLDACLRTSRWLVNNLEKNEQGVNVWHHHFDWEYRTPLIAPWYSGLAQGQGLSLLARAYEVSGDETFLAASSMAFESLVTETSDGGVLYIDSKGQKWIEEYIVDPPTHILNGFIWALWGILDHSLAAGDSRAEDLFDECVTTLEQNLDRFDTGWWSLYEMSGTRLKMVASHFYHSLHIVQLEIMWRLTGKSLFDEYSQRWRRYQRSLVNRKRASLQKAIFKLVHY